ncbi:hypothetical protein Tco_1232211 [Tanacetum coccineum]
MPFVLPLLEWSLLKQCAYSISEDDPPSTYMRCMKWPPIFASMIIGPSVPSSSPKGGNKISGSGEKLCVIFCLATFCHGWTIKIAITFFDHFFDLSFQMHALLSVMSHFPMEFTELVVVSFFHGVFLLWTEPNERNVLYSIS